MDQGPAGRSRGPRDGAGPRGTDHLSAGRIRAPYDEPRRHGTNQDPAGRTRDRKTNQGPIERISPSRTNQGPTQDIFCNVSELGHFPQKMVGQTRGVFSFEDVLGNLGQPGEGAMDVGPWTWAPSRGWPHPKVNLATAPGQSSAYLLS